jgi:hypothetical protein
MKETLSMLTKALFVCLCAFALISNAQVPDGSASPSTRQKIDVTTQQVYASPYDAVQNQRMDNIDQNVAALQRAGDKRQEEIEELIEAQSRWSGGLATLLGLIGFTSVIGLGIQIYEKFKKKD